MNYVAETSIWKLGINENSEGGENWAMTWRLLSLITEFRVSRTLATLHGTDHKGAQVVEPHVPSWAMAWTFQIVIAIISAAPYIGRALYDDTVSSCTQPKG